VSEPPEDADLTAIFEDFMKVYDRAVAWGEAKMGAADDGEITLEACGTLIGMALACASGRYPSDQEAEVQSDVLARGLGDFLADDFCCLPHAVAKIANISNMALTRTAADVGRKQPSGLDTAECKGSA
jgi:hypothetical protein